jgi:hypothetical protein
MKKLFAAALIMLMAAPVLAAPSAQSNRQVYEELRATKPQEWQRCRDLARERGYKGGELDPGGPKIYPQVHPRNTALVLPPLAGA